MDDKERMHRRISRIRELNGMENRDDAYWSIVNKYRSNADDFVDRLETYVHWVEVAHWERTGHKNMLWSLLFSLKIMLKDLEAMQDDAEASHDFME